MKKVGVVLSGCGVYDGSEIHETVLTLLALSRRGPTLSASLRIKRRQTWLIILPASQWRKAVTC